MLITVILLLVIILFVALFVVYLSKSMDSETSYMLLQHKYEDDTKPLKFQVSDLKTQIFELKSDKEQLNKEMKDKMDKIGVLEKNVYGKFEDGYIVSNAKNSCVTIADNTKGDFSYLQLNTLCKNPEKSNIFIYDPVYKQLILKLGDARKCVDTVNENDIIVNDCIKTSQKQKFNYFPLYDGRFKSMLYNKCLGYNPDTNIIELQKCGDVTNIQTPKEMQRKHLFLENI